MPTEELNKQIMNFTLELKDAKEKLKVAREALKWYSKYIVSCDGDTKSNACYASGCHTSMFACGLVAKEALNQIEDSKEDYGNSRTV